MIEWKTVRIDYPLLKGAQDIEEILCLATLSAMGTAHNLEQAKDWYSKFDCDECPFNGVCLACKINE